LRAGGPLGRDAITTGQKAKKKTKGPTTEVGELISGLGRYWERPAWRVQVVEVDLPPEGKRGNESEKTCGEKKCGPRDQYYSMPTADSDKSNSLVLLMYLKLVRGSPHSLRRHGAIGPRKREKKGRTKGRKASSSRLLPKGVPF